jgi:hypothetical protein
MEGNLHISENPKVSMRYNQQPGRSLEKLPAFLAFNGLKSQL